GAPRVHGALGVGADHDHVGVLLLEVASGARDGAARADPRYVVRDPAVGVAPDLGTGGLIVAERAVLVGVLVGLEGARDLAREPVAHRVVRVGTLGRDARGAHDHLGAVGLERVDLVFGDLVGAHEHALVAALLGDECEPDTRVTGGRLDDRAARLQLALGLRRVADARRDTV